MSDALVAAAQLCDAARVVAPRGAEDISLKLAPTETGALRVVAIGSTTTGPTWAALLGLDAAEYLGLVHGALEALANTNTDPATATAADLITLTFEPETARVSTSTQSHVLPAEALARFVFSPTLLETLLASAPELRIWHEAFSAEIRGHDEAKLDPESGALVLSRGVLPWRTLRARRLGTFELESGIFRWDLPEPDLADHGAAFTTPWFPCDEAFAVRLAGFTAHHLGARGLYPTQEPDQRVGLHSVS